MKVNQIRAGAALSYVSMALSTIISLVYTPIMLDRLGDSEFGVYQAVLPIISYLNLLSFGLGSAYVRYYSRFRAAGDKKGCAKLNGMFLITYLVLGAAVLAIGFGLSYCDVIFGKKLTAEEIALAEKLLRIMTVNAALTFPISVFESHVTINERYLFQKIVAMGKQVLNPLIMIPLLIIGYRSVALTVVSLIFTVLSGILLGFVAIGQSFVVLWGGDEKFAIDYWTTLLLFFSCLWTNVQTVGIEIQRAKNMHKFRSLVYLGVALGNAAISVPLCMKWQGLGAAIGTAIATLAGNVILMNWYYYRRIGLNIPAFWRHIFHLIPAMLLPAVTAVLLAVKVHPTTYWQLIPPGLIFVAVYAVCMWLFGLNRYERSLITAPLRRLSRR